MRKRLLLLLALLQSSIALGAEQSDDAARHLHSLSNDAIEYTAPDASAETLAATTGDVSQAEDDAESILKSAEKSMQNVEVDIAETGSQSLEKLEGQVKEGGEIDASNVTFPVMSASDIFPASPEAVITATPTLPQGVFIRLVHSEVQPTAAHTMAPGELILSYYAQEQLEPPAPTPLSISSGLIVPQPKEAPTLRAPPVQGATWAVGGQTYTASIDRQLNVVLGTSILRPGGAAATLANGEAVVSVVPGGALIVDGGTLTMSALRPPVTGAAVKLVGGRVVTASQRDDGRILVLGTEKVTSGAPARTVEGLTMSYGPDGLLVGDSTVALSTMTRALPPGVTATQWLTELRGPGLLKYGDTASGSCTETATAMGPNKSGYTSNGAVSRKPTRAVTVLALMFALLWLGR